MASKDGKKASEKTSREFRSGVSSSFLWSGGALPGRGVPSRVGRCNEVRHWVPRLGRSTPACRSPTTRFQTSPERRARLTWRARGLHERAPGAAFAGSWIATSGWSASWCWAILPSKVRKSGRLPRRFRKSRGHPSPVRCQPETNMKQPKSSTKARVPRTPLDPRRFPLSAQADATPGREKVREVAHPVHAPRQTKRRVERSSKSQTGA